MSTNLESFTSSFAVLLAVHNSACGSDSEVGSGSAASEETTASLAVSGGETTSGGGAAPDGDVSCPELTAWTEAIHYVLEVTWPQTTAGAGGEGVVELWSSAVYTAAGNDLSVALSACGSVLPAAPLSAVGQLVAGGETVLIQFPDSVWDNLTVPPTLAIGTQSGHGIGSSVKYAFNDILGVILDDPTGPWPAAGFGLATEDVDADGNPGYTAIPWTDAGDTVLPPTQITEGGQAPAADRVYVVSRQGIAIDGTRTACDAHSGGADVSFFDNHVVGCRLETGDECDELQTDFVDQSRMMYEVTGAKYEAQQVDDGASCSDIRAAVP